MTKNLFLKVYTVVREIGKIGKANYRALYYSKFKRRQTGTISCLNQIFKKQTTVNKTGKQQQQFILKIFPLLKQEKVSIPKAVLDLGPLIFCLDVMNGSSQENKHSLEKKQKK